jgi:bifunctional non-homologous end joining protein LigD
LAMMVEDHPVEYQHFSGKIPEGNYGAGEVRIWDKGTYQMIGEGDGIAQIKAGKLTFIMKGKKLKGEFHMVHTPRNGGENAWLLFKHKDEYAKPGWEIDQLLPYGSNKERREREEVSALDKLLGKKPAVKKAVTKKRVAAKTVRAVADAAKPKAKTAKVTAKAKVKKKKSV